MAGSPLPPADAKATEVRRMFGAIAPRYDLLNHLLSLNRDRAWRRGRWTACSAAARGRLPRRLRRHLRPVRRAGRPPRLPRHVLGFDFAYPMLDAGRAEADGPPILPACADALQLPLPDSSVDGAMVAFGVRNLADLDAGLQRVRPRHPARRTAGHPGVHDAAAGSRSAGCTCSISGGCCRSSGLVIPKHGSAYSYLPASVLAFPEPAELRAHGGGRLRRCGLGRHDGRHRRGAPRRAPRAEAPRRRRVEERERHGSEQGGSAQRQVRAPNVSGPPAPRASPVSVAPLGAHIAPGGQAGAPGYRSRRVAARRHAGGGRRVVQRGSTTTRVSVVFAGEATTCSRRCPRPPAACGHRDRTRRVAPGAQRLRGAAAA
jgi:demethylmenaquinone methyltransferase / 2-methoxy-6-polyprenyl-1,4-benzoquinol methylase